MTARNAWISACAAFTLTAISIALALTAIPWVGVQSAFASPTQDDPLTAGALTTQDQDETPSWSRLYGELGLDTMKAIVDEGWKGKTGGVVVLTTFDGYWDALTAAGIAGMAKAPVLMTYSNELAEQTRALIASLKPKTIVVCGGTAAVSTAVEQAAAEAAGGAETVRCWGATATGTAIDVFEKASSKDIGTWATTAFVCTNEGYWDALAAAPISYAKAMPIFLTEGQSEISNETLAAMKSGGITSVYIVGGTSAIDDSVKARIEASGIAVSDRLWGATAVETSEKVAELGLKLGMSTAGMGVATTNGYWDALAGAPLCGLNNSVLVLVENESSHSIKGFVKDHADDISNGCIFGGSFAVSGSTENALLAAIGALNVDYSAYLNVLDNAAKSSGDFEGWADLTVVGSGRADYKAKYILYDINGDGIQELFVNNSTSSEMYRKCFVYTLEGSTAVKCGTIAMRHVQLLALTNGALCEAMWDPSGIGYIATLSMEGTTLVGAEKWTVYDKKNYGGSTWYANAVKQVHGSDVGISSNLNDWKLATDTSAVKALMAA